MRWIPGASGNIEIGKYFRNSLLIKKIMGIAKLSTVEWFQHLMQRKAALQLFYLSYSVQTFKMIWQMSKKLWVNDISRNLSLRWVSKGSYLQQCPPSPPTEITWCCDSISRNQMVTEWWLHDDVIEWKHFPHYWPFVRGIHQSPVNSPQKGEWHRALMVSLICAWTKGWANHREAGDFRCHCAHYDFTVMGYFVTTKNAMKW